MSLVVWLVIGLCAGLIGSRMEKKSGESIVLDILLGVAGAVAGGFLYYTFGPPAIHGFHLISHYAAAAASLVILVTYCAIRRF